MSASGEHHHWFGTNRALAVLDVDRWAFDLMDRKFLEALIHRFDGGPVGLDNASPPALARTRHQGHDRAKPYLINRVSSSGLHLTRTHIATLAAPAPWAMAPPQSGDGPVRRSDSLAGFRANKALAQVELASSAIERIAKLFF
jgi:hypothetical protein